MTNTPSKDVFVSLNNAKKNTSILDQRKAQLEMKDCTFKPSIDKKSEKLALTTSANSKSYETLFKKHSIKMEKAQKLLKEKEDKETSECTFQPVLMSKQKTQKKSIQDPYQNENALDSDR